MFKQGLRWIGCAVVIVGCGSDVNQVGEGPTGNISLASVIEQSADVEVLRFTIQQVDCETGDFIGDPIEVDRPLSDQTLPGGIPELENAPLDEDSQHLFADLFRVVPAGCYDVASDPVTEDGEPSRMCDGAFKKGVVVEEGEVTEVFLVDQCHADDPGGIDVIETLNHEPEILDVRFERSKFVTCGDVEILCATAFDPDHDPLSFVWELDPGAPPATGPSIISHDQDPDTGEVTECVQFVPLDEGDYPFTLTVFDLLHDGGGLITFEQWLANEGYPSESHAMISLFFYSGEGDGGDGGGGGGPAPLGNIIGSNDLGQGKMRWDLDANAVVWHVPGPGFPNTVGYNGTDIFHVTGDASCNPLPVDRVDFATGGVLGSLTLTGNPGGLCTHLEDLAFTNATDLWGADLFNNRLVRWDVTTGLDTAIVPITGFSTSGAAVSSPTAIASTPLGMYASMGFGNINPAEIGVINLTTGVYTPVFQETADVGYIHSIAYDSVRQVLWENLSSYGPPSSQVVRQRFLDGTSAGADVTLDPAPVSQRFDGFEHLSAPIGEDFCDRDEGDAEDEG